MHNAFFLEFGRRLTRIARFALGALLMSGGVAAHAQSDDEPKFYVGTGVVFVDIDTGTGATAPCSVNLCERETDFGLMFGYEINRFAALEAGYYVTSGPAVYDPNNPRSSMVGSEWDTSTYYLAMIGRLPLGGTAFALTTRLGAHFWDDNGSGVFDNPDREKDDVGALYGFGLDADLTDHLRFQATWADYLTDEVLDRQVVGANLVVRF